MPEPPAPEVEKLFRSDVARLNPVVAAEIVAAPGARVGATLGGVAVGPVLSAGPVLFELPPERLRALEKAAPNSLVFRAEDGSPVAVRSFRLQGRDGLYHDPCAPHAAARPNPATNP